MNQTDLTQQLIKTIAEPTSMLWFPELTNELIKVGREIIKDECGLILSEYGTNRIWHKDKNARLDVATVIQTPLADSSTSDFIQIEILDEEIICSYKESEIEFYEKEEIIETSVIDCIAEAVETIRLVPSLLTTVFALIRSLHLIKLDDNDFDVSFSEPHIPFSVFVSTPTGRIRTDYLRVAEAIVHESMHLQLSLIERVIPLVCSLDRKFYSPWKQELRNSQGILHALYVFRVIEAFYKTLEASISLETNLNFIQKRRREISTQVTEIQNFAQSSDLTSEGYHFVKKLLYSNNHDT